MAVAVKVPYRHRLSPVADRVGLGCLEGAVTVALQDADGALTRKSSAQVDHREVEDAIAVKISHREGFGVLTDGVVLRSLESAVPMAQQNAHTV